MQSKELRTNISELFKKSIKSIEQLYKIKLNKNRTDFMELVVLGLVNSRSVQFGEIADKMEGEASTDSKQRRIQHFIGEYGLNYEFIACFLLVLLPQTGRLKLCIDRTEWEFGGQNHNILVLTAYSHGVGIPIWFEVLDNDGGNSHTDDRIYTMMKIIELLGKKRIKCVVGDCEFIGKDWIKWLIKERIRFYIDVRTNQQIVHKGKKYVISHILQHHKTKILNKVWIFEAELGLALKANNRTGKKCLAVVTNHEPSQSLQNYADRWSIEVLFASIKTKGFDLEATHLKCPIRLRKLFALVSMAFAVCFLIGVVSHRMKPIKTKNHGYKANSFFRHGLNILRQSLKKNSKLDFDNIIKKIIHIIQLNSYIIQKIVM